MKKYIWLLSVAVAGSLVWYLFIRDHDFQVRFQVNAHPGTINQTLKKWANTFYATKIEQLHLDELQQTISINNNQYLIHWKFEPVSDTVTTVTASFLEPDNSIINRLLIPVSKTDLEINAEKYMLEFFRILKEHLSQIRISVEGLSEVKEVFCACVDVRTTQLGKAKGMMENYNFLSSFIVKNHLQPNGVPIVVINTWDMDRDRLVYDFCYPVIRNESLPESPVVKYKRIPNQKAIKAVYNGNYITSDRAWYAILQYAEHRGLSVVKKPIEYFYNNPNVEANEQDWRADVYLPIE